MFQLAPKFTENVSLASVSTEEILYRSKSLDVSEFVIKQDFCAATVTCFKFRVYKRRNRVYSMKGPDISSLSDVGCYADTGKNNGFPFLDILGYLKDTHKNPKFAKVRQIPVREFPTKFPIWDLSHSSKFGIFVGIL